MILCMYNYTYPGSVVYLTFPVCTHHHITCKYCILQCTRDALHRLCTGVYCCLKWLPEHPATVHVYTHDMYVLSSSCLLVFLSSSKASSTFASTFLFFFLVVLVVLVVLVLLHFTVYIFTVIFFFWIERDTTPFSFCSIYKHRRSSPTSLECPIE